MDWRDVSPLAVCVGSNVRVARERTRAAYKVSLQVKPGHKFFGLRPIPRGDSQSDVATSETVEWPVTGQYGCQARFADRLQEATCGRRILVFTQHRPFVIERIANLDRLDPRAFLASLEETEQAA